MILVTLGTQDKDFSRLLKSIDKLIIDKKIKEEVIVQAGSTKYKSDNMKIFDLISKTELDKLVKECNLLITHGGVGSILSGLKHNKKIIAVARRSEYKEHTNNHQQEIIDEFVKRGYILEAKNLNQLDEIIDESTAFIPEKYKSNTKNVVKMLDKYIQEDNHYSWYNRYKLLFILLIVLIVTLIFILIFIK